MNAIKYLNQVLNEGAAWVPVWAVENVRGAASALGVCVCGGAFDTSGARMVLYVA